MWGVFFALVGGLIGVRFMVLRVGWVGGHMDNLYYVLRLTRAGRFKFFARGWGQLQRSDDARDALRANLIGGRVPARVSDSLRWREDDIELDHNKLKVRRGVFDSPLVGLLPEDAKRCHFTMVVPRSSPVAPWSAASSGRPEGVVILLPATGEEGISLRLPMAEALAKERNWATLIIEAPYYGLRRPREQPSYHVLDVESFLLQSYAIMQEAALLRLWVEELWPGAPVTMSGFSWGAAMCSCGAVIAAQWSKEPRLLAAAPYVGSATPAVVVDGILADDIDWEALIAGLGPAAEAADAPDGGADALEQLSAITVLRQYQERTAAKERAYDKLYAKLIRTHLRTLTGLPGVTLKRLGGVQSVSMDHDRFVKPEYSDELFDLLSGVSDGVKSHTWVAGGHVLAFLRRLTEQKDAICRAMESLRGDRTLS